MTTKEYDRNNEQQLCLKGNN